MFNNFRFVLLYFYIQSNVKLTYKNTYSKDGSAVKNH